MSKSKTPTSFFVSVRKGVRRAQHSLAMKTKLIFSIFFLVTCVSLYAQDTSELRKIFLQDGTTFNAYVEKQVDGGYKLTTVDGSVFIFREGEISIDRPYGSVSDYKYPVKELKYRELKKMYSAKSYSGREPGDKYSPAAVGIASFLIPGLGQYITGSQVGWGILQTALAAGAAFIGVLALERECPEALVYPMVGVHAGTAIWSACSAAKAAKIKNLYYRDLRNGVAYKFDVTPYFDVTAPVFASNQNFVTGLSFRVSF